MAGTVPLLLVALALLLRPESAGASVGAPARGDEDHGPGPVGPGPGPGRALPGGARGGTGGAHAAAARGAAEAAAPARSIGDDPGRSTLLARGRAREATARGHAARSGTPHVHDDPTPCRMGPARVGATLQVWGWRARVRA